MRTVHINDLRNFIRKHDYGQIYKGYSNNKLRQFIYSRLNKHTLYVMEYRRKIVGIIEYYRLNNYEDLRTRQVKQQPLYTTEKGKTIWINNLIIDKKQIKKGHFKKFMSNLKEFDNIYWWKFKNNKIMICQLRGT